MNIKPMVDRVLVREEETATVSKGGVVLPNASKFNDLVYGVVVSLGLPRKDYLGGDEIKVGDRVALIKLSAANISDGIDNLLIVRYDDILAVIK